MKIDTNNRAALKRSIADKMSPVSMNMPFNNRKPAKNSVIWSKGVIPNIRDRNTIDASMSRPPRIFTKTICLFEEEG
ncbi:hypothetical protein CMI47_22180 [Candidatus Pacearchaeota archaeon]|nr:hypothetical protein [Candidatus Pacearchaeota archaeon]